MKNHNVSIIADTNRIFGLKGDNIKEIREEIFPVVNITPRINCYSLTSNNLNGNATLYTTPSDADFYLCSLQLSRTKDVTADTTGSAIKATIEGVSKQILYMSGLTATAQAQDLVIEFPLPVKIDRGTTIIVNASRTVGNTQHAAAISGYVMQTIASGGI